MGESKYSVMWDAHTNSICKGLSKLQQRGEFVDMTLAADGHFVKVHKMVMCLISPYIKELISSADCSHPVIFLNQISYETLASILEYAYTGQVSVEKNQLNIFMEACHSLHISGFENMESDKVSFTTMDTKPTNISSKYISENMHSYSLTEPDNRTDDENDNEITKTEYLHIVENENDGNELEEDIKEPIKKGPIKLSTFSFKEPSVQYSLSNHGNLQLILNRYVYNLRYSARKNGQRTWQCVDGHCKGKKCPARVVTHGDVILGRVKPHNHPHHDKKILQKVQARTIFATLRDAEQQVKRIQREKEKEYQAACNNTK
ncbi:protein bric-a-brac 1 [Manduca sexta]|uniref:BTB domain-containing protein n=1 Tax=Manduca sexta TaxID=7130 RepID=A0A922CQC8_MANSE|nr:protein bric-a-brac 1 [Manduca sexta]KAG6455510.1 hypothetical protein O3G_MSEX009242 [Manduca sexta]